MVVTKPADRAAESTREQRIVMTALPLADVDDFRSGDSRSRAAFTAALGRSLEEHGFVAIAGHNIRSELLDEAYRSCRAFFDLPLEVKRRYTRPDLDGQRGYTGFRVEHARDHAAADLKEFYQIGRDLPAGHPDRSPYGGNVWSAEIPEFAAVFAELYAQLENLAETLLAACSEYLGEGSAFLPDVARNGDSILRVIHYPPTPDDVPPGSMRSAPHEDINLITLLCGATASGLELLDREGNWVAIQTQRDQIVVNCGDMLQNLTNGLFRSVKHRVVNPAERGTRRFSLPFFVHPRRSVDLSPLPGCLARTSGCAVFPSITAGEYLTQRLEEIGLLNK